MSLIKRLNEDKIYYTKLKMGMIQLENPTEEMISIFKNLELDNIAKYSSAVLTMVISKAKEIAKDKKLEEPTDEIVCEAIRKELKQLEQTKDACVNSHKDVLLEETLAKIEFITHYLPKQLNADELEIKIKDILANMEDTSNRGLVMKTVMTECKNIADGKTINMIVSKLL